MDSTFVDVNRADPLIGLDAKTKRPGLRAALLGQTRTK